MLHHELNGGVYGLPGWGTTADSAGHQGWILCCDATTIPCNADAALSEVQTVATTSEDVLTYQPGTTTASGFGQEDTNSTAGDVVANGPTLELMDAAGFAESVGDCRTGDGEHGNYQTLEGNDDVQTCIDHCATDYQCHAFDRDEPFQGTCWLFHNGPGTHTGNGNGASRCQVKGGSGHRNIIAVRFVVSADHLDGSHVRTASISFAVAGPINQDNLRMVIYCEASDDAAAISSGPFDISTRVPTETGLVWSLADDPSWSEAGNRVRTPDLAPLLQEVINRQGWKPGQAVVFIIGHLSGVGTRVVDTSAVPVLSFEYLFWSAAGTSPPS